MRCVVEGEGLPAEPPSGPAVVWTAHSSRMRAAAHVAACTRSPLTPCAAAWRALRPSHLPPAPPSMPPAACCGQRPVRATLTRHRPESADMAGAQRSVMAVATRTYPDMPSGRPSAEMSTMGLTLVGGPRWRLRRAFRTTRCSGSNTNRMPSGSLVALPNAASLASVADVATGRGVLELAGKPAAAESRLEIMDSWRQAP